MKTYESKNANDAIKQIESIHTTFMGQNVQKYNHAIEIRGELQSMMQRREITPKIYYDALKITYGQMSDSEKKSELMKLN